MKYTINLNLKKPDYTDPADVANINANMDVLDSTITAQKAATASQLINLKRKMRMGGMI